MLNIPTDNKYDDTYWIAAYLAGMGMLPEELKEGIQGAFIGAIATNYTLKLEESEDEMFIAGVAVSELNHDREVTARYARVNRLRDELYHVLEINETGAPFFAQFTRDELKAFAHFLAGIGYASVSETTFDELQALRSRWGGQEEMDSFILGFM